jgi:competence protein ComEC
MKNKAKKFFPKRTMASLFLPAVFFISGIRLQNFSAAVIVAVFFIAISTLLLMALFKASGQTLSKKTATMATLALIGSMLCGVFYYKLRCETGHSGEKHPECNDVTITLVADSIVFRDRKHGIFYGYGTIVGCEKQCEWLKRERIFFNVDAACCEKLPMCGQKFEVSGVLRAVKRKSDWWFSKHLRNLQIGWQISNGYLVRCCEPASLLKSFFGSIFEKFSRAITAGVQDRGVETGIMLGMLTGAKDRMDSFSRTMFSDLGISHLFAVSGLHIGIIATAIDFLLRFFSVRKKMRIFPTLILLTLYVNAIGCSPSSLRAVTMVAFYFGAILLGRRPNVLSALANSALLHALYDPFAVFSISFLLSYAVVAGIVLIGVPLQNFLSNLFLNLHGLRIESYPRMHRISLKFKRALIVSFSISVAGHLMSLPLSIEHFGIVSLLTVPINVLVVPIATAAIIVGATSLFFGLCGLWPICAILNKIACFLIYVFRIVSQSMYCDSLCFRGVKLSIISGSLLTALILVIAYIFFLCNEIFESGRIADDTAALPS